MWPDEKDIEMLVTSLCWWLHDGDSLKMLVAECFWLFNVTDPNLEYLQNSLAPIRTF